MSRLKEIEERCEKATKGPWTAEYIDDSVPVSISGPDGEFDHVLWGRVCDACAKRKGRCTAPSESDTDFIVHARSDIPYLISELRAALARAEGAEELVREVARSGVELDDERIDYVTVQIDRATWGDIARIAELEKP